MRRILDSIYDISRYTSTVEKDRARMVYGMSTLMLALLVIFLIITRDAEGQSILFLLGSNTGLATYVFLFFAPTVASLFLTRTGRLVPASIALILAFVLGLGITAVQSGLYTVTNALVLAIIILMSGLLLGSRGLFIGTILTVVMGMVSVANRSNVPPPATFNSVNDAIALFIGGTLISGFTYLFLRYAQVNRREGMAIVNEERLKLAEITTQVSQRISRRMALNEVLNNAVDQIQSNYPAIYHAQIFLVDENRQSARLVASTGEVGRMLLDRKHSLPVGSLSVIGQVTVQGKHIIARAGAQDGIHRRNEFLPDTAVEAAFPLRIGEQIIGALDMQSKERDAFAEDDIPTFQSLADHLAIAIDNARLFEETERRLQDNQRLVEQTQRAAREVERLNQQLTGHFWEEYLRSQGDSLGLNVDFKTRNARPDEEWTPALQEAVAFNHPIQQKGDGAHIIAVPLRVRGQVIGAMEFELDETGNLSPEDLNLIEEVGEQLGLAAETNRLFETSQRVAQREALVNEIATRLQASNNVEMTLNEAARSLRSTLKANRVAIRLGTPTTTNGNGNHKEGG
jgi:GAF domain-containing protein